MKKDIEKLISAPFHRVSGKRNRKKALRPAIQKQSKLLNAVREHGEMTPACAEMEV